ncbi:XrtA system polysaccharide chain length determinant [Novosphingobium aquiterrae]|uniref:XrtA system polysaccharide chain length determinant n=1 Tax=Novosphingobium aquiterrae TaxID=624388 RepID=A0ABV6PJ60_9SPHN
MNSIFDEARAAVFSVWHRRWLALAVAWGICMVGWLLVAMIPNNYESRARIFVQLDDVLADVTGVPSDGKRDIDRVRQTLTSAVNLEKVIRGTSLGNDITTPKAMENTILSLAKTVKVESQQENLFEITARYGDGVHSDAENAKLAQDIVQKMIDIFREENLAGNRGEMTTSLDFMNQQLAVRQKELETAEQKRLAFEAQNPDAAGGGLSVLQKLEASRAELRGIDADLAAAQSALAAINGQLAGTPKTLPGMASTGGAKGAYAQAQADLNAMRARGLTENHPDVIAAKNQVNALRAAASSEGGPSGTPNPAYSSLESIRADRQATVMGLTARRAAVQGDVSRITSQQITNPQVVAEQQRINRDYDVLKQQYDKLLQDREELRLRGQVQTEHSAVKFQVIDPPTTPRGPVWPNRPLMLLAVLFAGIGGGVAAAFAMGQLRSTFATTAKLERALGLPVLGAITTTLTDGGRDLRRKRGKLFYAASGALAVVFALLLTAEYIQRGLVA